MLVGIAATGIVGSRASAWGQAFTREDAAFADALIQELRYFDTARRWLDGLRRQRGMRPADLAEIESRLIDILQAEGRKDEYLAALERFKKEFPFHLRAARGSIERIGTALGEIVASLEKARKEDDAAKAALLIEQAKSAFAEDIEKPLDSLVAELAKGAKDGAGNGRPAGEAVAYEAELARVQVYLAYARGLPSKDPDREKLLEKGLERAVRFVDERVEFPIMRYEAQIQKGLYLYELGRHVRAAEELDLLLDLGPPGRPPYHDVIKKAFWSIRLKAYLFAARAYNGAERYRDAVDRLERIVRDTPEASDPLLPVLGVVEKEADLEQFAVLARLEYGVALTGSGRSAQGMEVIHGMISRYEDLHKSTGDEKYRAFAVDARKALGRLAASGSVVLSGRDYYQAGIGLKSELRFEGALKTFQAALGTLGEEDRSQYGPMCLNEIGEISFMLGRYDEAAVAFWELEEAYPYSSIFRTKAATSFTAAVNKAKTALGAASTSHAGFNFLEQKASRHITGTAEYQRLLANAQLQERKGEYARARATYRQVPAEDQNGSVSYYPRAQASAWATFVREYEVSREESERTAVAESFGAAIPELEKILAESRKALEANGSSEDLVAAAVAALALGQIHYYRNDDAKAIAVLAAFARELAEEEHYRCAGLGYLVLAAVRAGQGESAAPYFAAMHADCPEDPATASAAWALAQDAAARGEAHRAAIFMLEYARHPESESELKELPALMRVIQVLVDGGLISEAKRYLDLAKSLGSTGSGDGESLAAGDAGRELLYLEARAARAAKDWRRVVELLSQYVKKYGVQSGHYEDPYVCRDLGWATIQLARQKKPEGTLPLEYAKRANTYYGHALSLLHGYMQRTPPDAIDPQFWRDYWTMALRLMQVKSHLGRAGDTAEFVEIHKFVNENQHRIRETRYWPHFEKVWREALEAAGEDAGKYVHPETKQDANGS